MSRARSLRIAALLALAGASGCTHNHYYVAGAPLCEETPAVVRYGEVCEVPVPSRVGVAEAPRDSRVQISQPQGRIGSRMAWRKPDPDSLATTRVEGGLDDSTFR